MKVSLALLLFVVVCYFAQADGHYIWRGRSASGEQGEKCSRAFMRRARSWIQCSYLCSGWPIRRENEEDGSPCTTWFRGKGSCLDGRCVLNVDSRSNAGPTPESPGTQPEPTEPEVNPVTETKPEVPESEPEEQPEPSEPEEEPVGPPEMVPSGPEEEPEPAPGEVGSNEPGQEPGPAPEQVVPSEPEQQPGSASNEPGPAPEQVVPSVPEEQPGVSLNEPGLAPEQVVPDMPEEDPGTAIEPMVTNEPGQEDAGERGQEVPTETKEEPAGGPEIQPFYTEEQPGGSNESFNPEAPVGGGPDEVPQSESRVESAASPDVVMPVESEQGPAPHVELDARNRDEDNEVE